MQGLKTFREGLKNKRLVIAIFTCFIFISLTSVDITSDYLVLEIEENSYKPLETKINEDDNNVSDDLLAEDMNTINESNEAEIQEFNMLLGTWKISSFINHCIESHCKEAYNMDYSKIKNEAERYVGKEFKIDNENVTFFSPRVHKKQIVRLKIMRICFLEKNRQRN